MDFVQAINLLSIAAMNSMQAMISRPGFSKYVVDFFHTERRSTDSKESMRLEADTDSDAIEQARWLARRTAHHHYQVRAAAGHVHVVIFASMGAAAA
jgi:hypothetical protein